MAPSYNRDSVIRAAQGTSFSRKRAREFDKYLNSLPTGTIIYRWVDSNGNTVGFNH